MAKISLRDYNRKIESMIDHGQNEEAVFHCLSILSSFPKSVDTYRNLGKALLESKRYPEASEIFSKLLTVVPDDFISHVGQSIIAEEDRDLDTSIWHMEQAFELQPSNLALQEELRRLIGRRDGTPPSKIRLTRGALVRMYVRGDLYQQAISEIQSALKDDPRRNDLRVLLARMYHQSGQDVEAAEACSNILSTSPYCFEANKIMYELLQASDEGKIYKDRLIQLDPYLEFSTTTGQNSIDIPSERVMVEEAVFTSSVAEPETIPDWAKNIGIDWKSDERTAEKSVSGELSALVSDEPGQPESSGTYSPFIPDQIHVEQESDSVTEKPLFSDEEIPDWIKNAGWSKANEPEKAPEVPVEYDSSAASSEAQPADDLPEWLKSMQPETEKDFLLKDSASIGNLSGGPVPENESIDEVLPSSEDLKGSIENWSKDIEPMDESPEIPQMPQQSSEWLNQFMDEQAQPVSDAESSDLPDWLKNYEKDEPSEETLQSEAPDWLTSLESPEIGEPPDLKDILEVGEPPELKNIPGIAESTPENLEVLTTEIQEPETEPVVEHELVPEFEQELAEVSSESLQLTEIPHIPEIFEKQITEEPVEQHQAKGAQTAAIPSWIDEILSSTLPVAAATEISETEEPEQVSDETEPLLSELPPELPHEGILSDETSNELLDWLNELSPEEKQPDILTASPYDFEREIPARVNTSELTLENLSAENLELVTGNESIEESGEQELIEEIEPLDYTDRLSELITEVRDETVSPQEIESTELIPSFLPDVDKLIVTDTELIRSESVDKQVSPFEEHIPIVEMEQGIPVVSDEEVLPEGIIEEFLPEVEPESAPSAPSAVETDLDTLIESDRYEDLLALAENRLVENHPIKDLIEKLSSVSESKGTSPRFWQSFGDLLGKNSDFDSALEAYQKAETLILSK